MRGLHSFHVIVYTNFIIHVASLYFHMLSWNARRQVDVVALLAGLFLVVAFLVWALVLRTPKSCSDGILNQNELGVDCGGACSLVCETEVVPVSTLWSRVFRVRPGVYSAGSLLENPNISFHVENLRYSFKLYDVDNVLVVERTGTTFVNARERTAIFEGNIQTGERIPVRAFIEIAPPTWTRVVDKVAEPNLVVEEKKLTLDNKPRLEATLRNSGVQDYFDIDVVALVSDDNGNVVAMSKTFVNSLLQGGARRLTFTWDDQFPSVPSAISLYPRIDRTKSGI